MYVQYQCYLESLTNAEVVSKTASLLSNDTLQYVVATQDFDKMIIYSELNEVHLFVRGEIVSVDEIYLPTRKDELIVKEYCKRYGHTCLDR